VSLHDALQICTSDNIELRLGYLLTDKVWGLGLGSELICGLVKWVKTDGRVALILGGVDKDNIGSFRVLEKNGFLVSESKSILDAVVCY